VSYVEIFGQFKFLQVTHAENGLKTLAGKRETNCWIMTKNHSTKEIITRFPSAKVHFFATRTTSDMY